MKTRVLLAAVLALAATGTLAQKQPDAAARREKLTPDAQRECKWLDDATTAQVNNARLARLQERQAAQRELQTLRTRARELRC